MASLTSRPGSCLPERIRESDDWVIPSRGARELWQSPLASMALARASLADGTGLGIPGL